VAAAYLQDGLEGWLKESTVGQRGNILIPTKLVVVDFTSKAPSVISGSHNLSKAASENNDENFLMPVLDVTDGWAKGYFSGGNLKTADRLRFSAA
jgi:hypothetical protein